MQADKDGSITNAVMHSTKGFGHYHCGRVVFSCCCFFSNLIYCNLDISPGLMFCFFGYCGEGGMGRWNALRGERVLRRAVKRLASE